MTSSVSCGGLTAICNWNSREYRMAVHIFGAVSSPSIANFALKATADKAEEKYGTEVADTIRKNFYVDDWLKSAANERKVIHLIKDVQSACAEGGFRLTKFVSNSRDVLKSIPTEDRAKQIQTCNLDYDEIPIERALGLQWHVSTDMFGFSTDLPSKLVTRRGILSTVSSLYDPLGMVSPVILPAKKILQDLCVDKTLGWDDEILPELNHRWKEWLSGLPQLNDMRIPRCLRPVEFGRIVCRQLHLFSDASSIGYGCVAYLRLLDEGKNINVSFLMGKSRLAPVRTVTIPRLELTAASVSLQLGQQLLNQLDMEIDEVSYYTDSTTVLHYINNEAKRFPVFVANRVRLIRDYSQPSQWKFIDSRTNPADIASRGMSIGQFLHADTWFHGPKFLHAHESEWPDCSIPSTPAETVQTTDLQPEMNHCMEKLISHYSNWYRLKRALAVYIFLRDVLHSRIKQKHKLKEYHTSTDQPFTVGRLEEAELVIIKYVQHVAFPSECESLSDAEC
ncbi:uncharacterized protein LOC124274523 [Haliotis rubra]|uniref:uncharacterized protein LOC124274523 n=1 Tax=Haliotis rubra TaxID=36100 RepID=UPI001EE4FD9B|nr:uncharacterized protein LOC124274523 [Haliotis rubra]